MSIPFIVLAFIAVSIFIYLVPLLTGKNAYAYKSEMAVNPDTLRHKDYTRLVTSQFTHWDIFHLGVNMYSLFNVGGTVVYIASIVLGSNIKFAPIVFAGVYIIGGVVASLFSIKFSRTISAGASGAIFALIGFITAFAILTNSTQLLQSLLIVGIINVAIGFMPGMNVDNWAHLGGFLAGLAMGFLLIGGLAIV